MSRASPISSHYVCVTRRVPGTPLEPWDCLSAARQAEWQSAISGAFFLDASQEARFPPGKALNSFPSSRGGRAAQPSVSRHKRWTLNTASRPGHLHHHKSSKTDGSHNTKADSRIQRIKGFLFGAVEMYEIYNNEPEGAIQQQEERLYLMPLLSKSNVLMSTTS